MKVFDLCCPSEHVFEAWFGSEDDFRSQMERGLLECPMCGSQDLRKGLSAPRLNLGAKAVPYPKNKDIPTAPPTQNLRALQAAWLDISRRVVAQSEDVGTDFAEVALRMHHGEEPDRAIRGQATVQKAVELIEEGVAVMPLLLPNASKETLQ